MLGEDDPNNKKFGDDYKNNMQKVSRANSETCMKRK
jgi:hypothetical protein